MENSRTITSLKPSPAIFKKLMDQRRLTLGGISTNPSNNSSTPRISNGGGRKRHSLSTMGVRETDEMMSKLKKENFDLRLNFAKKQEILQKKADKVDHLEEIIKDLKEQVEVLQRALDERDEALSYAAGLVMEKDQEIDILLNRIGSPSSHNMAKLEKDLELTELVEQSPTIPRKKQESSIYSIYCDREEAYENEVGDQSIDSRLTSHTPVRPKRLDTLLSPTTPFLNSPALSVLSESSFQSVYDTCDNDDGITDYPEDDGLGWSPVSSIRKPLFHRLLATDWSGSRSEVKPTPKKQDIAFGRSYRSPLKFGREGSCVSVRRPSSGRERRQSVNCSTNSQIHSLKDSQTKGRHPRTSKLNPGLLTPSDTPSKLIHKATTKTARSKPLSTKNKNSNSNNNCAKTTKLSSSKGARVSLRAGLGNSPSDDKENRTAVGPSMGHAVKQAVQRINERADAQNVKRNTRTVSQNDKGISERIITRRRGA